jgi:primosomal protein N' (replication factor Y)
MPAQPASSPPAEARRLHVLLPLPLDGAYDYLAPPELALGPGDFVVAPLGGRRVAGVVWGEGPADAGRAVAEAKQKPDMERLPVPPMRESLRRFVARVAAYACSAPGAVLRMCMSSSSALQPERPRLGYRLAGPPPERLTPARSRVIALLADGPPRSGPELAELAGVGVAVVRGLCAAGTLEQAALPEHLPVPQPDWRRPGLDLSERQRAVADELVAATSEEGFSATLLDGVTGSGKTEVYFEAVAAALARDRQVLVLVPEIALTAAWLRRFEARFGAPPVEWHSELRSTQRRRNWRAVARGEAKVVVAARSGLFLPFPDLGLIVVDEEHEHAFKQEDGVIYQARDMAVLRASIEDIPIVLASATPSLETLANVEAGRYRRLELPGRPGLAELPEVATIDLRAEPPPRGQFLSPRLVAAVEQALAAGEQALLFLNRRGYAPLTLCRACGHRLECPNCSAWLVEHRFHARLQCHHCGFSCRVPPACPECGAEGRFAPCGPGVERVLEEAQALFPEARAMVVASDTVQGPEAAAEFVRRITAHEVDLIVGTQIVAKGHHFPLLTCVGVVDADLGLQGGDLRAAERTWQILSQVAGRAGRAERRGRAFLQTWLPEHPVMAALAAGDRAGFLAHEQEARREAGMPPYGRLVALIVASPSEAEAAECARALARAAPRLEGVEVLGPAPAPLSLLRGRFRFRLLMRTGRNLNASELARRWVGEVKAASSVRVTIDVDPYSFL